MGWVRRYDSGPIQGEAILGARQALPPPLFLSFLPLHFNSLGPSAFCFWPYVPASSEELFLVSLLSLGLRMKSDFVKADTR